MSRIALEPNASGTGTFTIASPNSNTSRTLTLPDADGALLTDASSLDASNLTGALPAIDGSALTGIATTPAGAIIYVAMSSAPSGYLKANGAGISRANYPDLFAAIGTTFGAGDGSYTFNLPDLRGEFLRGWDDARGVDSGRSFGSAQADAFQGHKHQSQTGDSSIAGGQYTIGRFAYSTSTSFVLNPISDGVNGTPRTSSETRPRNIAALACIKY